MPANLVSFIQVLRSHDVRVSPAETLDAMNVTTLLGYSDRGLLRNGLAMALAKTPEEESVFLQCFDRFFDRKLSDFSNEDPTQFPDSPAQDEIPQGEPNEAGEGNEQAPGAEADSALEAAAANSAELEALLTTPLMQALLSNDRNALSLAMSRAGESTACSRSRCLPRKASSPARFSMLWVRSRSGAQ